MVSSEVVDSGQSYRADIDGLRAIAVLSVVGFHAFPKTVPGGFVGVDVFFVISGYLISNLILDGLRNGTFSFADFYQRRARRLFPALAIVMITVWALALLVLEPPDLASLGRHTMAGAGFAANILTFFTTGYFDAPASTKPLLHLWSLGVEEQFYLLYPALLVLLWRSRWARVAVVALGVASFAANVALVRDHPSFVFYLPMTRFWEFAAGALIGFRPSGDGSDQGAPLSPAWRNVCAAAGLVLLAAAFRLTPPDGFPGWWAVLPVLGAALIIGAGQQAWANRTILAHPKLVSVGLISYPLYLWHWPLLVLAHDYMFDRDITNLHTRTTSIAVVVVSFALAWLTYRFIERPARAKISPWSGRRRAIASLAGLAVVAAVGMITDRSDGFLSFYPEEIRGFLSPMDYGEDFPKVDETKNRTGPLVVTYGDSHADHLRPGLVEIQSERAFRFKQIGWGKCASVDNVKEGFEESCRALTIANEKLFAELKPDIVILGAFWLQYPHLERLRDTLRFFQKIGVPRIVVIGTLPHWWRPPRILLYRAFRADPLHRLPERLRDFDADTLKSDRVLKQITGEFGAVFVSAYDTLCNEQGCLVRLGKARKDIVQIDNTHFSAAGSKFFIGRAADAIFGPVAPARPPS